MCVLSRTLPHRYLLLPRPDWSKADVKVIKNNGTHIMTNTAYRMFALLGNEKIPQVHNIGMMGVYMNQFPFDLDRPVTELNL